MIDPMAAPIAKPIAKIIFIGTVMVLFGAKEPANPGATLYVDDDALVGGDGKSWGSALRYLQDALTTARKSREVAEIRVAQGVYKPDQGEGVTGGDVHTVFDLVNGVSLQGGYAGVGAENPDARNPAVFVTALSGDLLGNDGPNFTNYADNAYRVVRATGLDPTTLIEGMLIIATQRDPDDAFTPGGGISCVSGGLTVRACRFERNNAFHGAGIGILAGELHVQQCVFTYNTARHGAGMSAHGPLPNDWPHVTIEDCAFTDNWTDLEDGAGIVAGGNTIVRRCYFARNHADDGGGIVGGSPLVEDCLFELNTADYGGALAGGGTYRRCILRSNRAHSSGGAFSNVVSSSNQHARFIDCDFIHNETNAVEGGAAYGGAAFVNCRFLGNRSGISNGGPFAPGGAIHAHAPTTLIANCIFSGNTSPGAGGAIDVRPGNATTIINSTFVNNSAAGAGEAVNGSATICNSTFGQHPGAPLAGISSVDYSCLPTTTTFPGNGNIAADPRFVNPLGPDGIAGTEDDDLRLRADSPCIDAADTTALPADQFDLDGDGDATEPLPLDAFGNCRVLETPAVANTGIPSTNGTGVVDMGAHEYRRPADIAPDIGDGVVDVDDLITVILHWGPCEPPDDPAWSPACVADIDGDGQVAVFDLVAVILSWG